MEAKVSGIKVEAEARSTYGLDATPIQKMEQIIFPVTDVRYRGKEI